MMLTMRTTVTLDPDTLELEIRALGVPVHRIRARRGPAALLSVPRLARLLPGKAGIPLIGDEAPCPEDLHP